MFSTVYHDRVFAAGDGGADANSNPHRISWSNAGTSITWTAADFIDVEDTLGESITGLSVSGNDLLIFKQNSVFAYNERTLRQRLRGVGAYNHYVVQSIDGLKYTFCPAGVFVTNGISARKISEPIEDMLRQFVPRYETTYHRVINNCFAGVYDKKYILWVGNMYFPSPDNRVRSLSSCMFVYDTVTKSWSMYRSPSTDTFTYFLSTPGFTSGGNATSGNKWQGVDSMFGVAGANAIFFRMFDNREQGYDTGLNTRGDKIFADNIANSAGDPISTIIETPLIDSGSPSTWKKYGFLRVFIEQGDVHMSYRLDKGTHLTDWIPMGFFKSQNTRKPLKDDQGFRIAIRATTNQGAYESRLNPIAVEEIETINQQAKEHATL